MNYIKCLGRATQALVVCVYLNQLLQDWKAHYPHPRENPSLFVGPLTLAGRAGAAAAAVEGFKTFRTRGWGFS